MRALILALPSLAGGKIYWVRVRVRVTFGVTIACWEKESSSDSDKASSVPGAGDLVATSFMPLPPVMSKPLVAGHFA